MPFLRKNYVVKKGKKTTMNEEKKRFLGNGVVALITGFTAGTLLNRACLFKMFTKVQGLNYSNAQVEIIYLCGLLGLGFGVPVAYLQKCIKPYYIVVLGCLGSTVAFLLLWTATMNNGWYSDKVQLLAIYNFLAGHSVSYLYYTSLWIGFSDSRSSDNIVSLLHHLPFVCSALVLWLIISELRYLLFAQFGFAITSSIISIILLKTPSTVDMPVRVVGVARTFILPAYEYPASDTESIAESAVSSIEESTPTYLRPNRVIRILTSVRDAVPHIIAFSLATTSALPYRYEKVSNVALRIVLSSLSAVFAALAGAYATIPRTNLLLIALISRTAFLVIAVAGHQALGMDVLLYGSGGLVQGAFWTTTPQMLLELHGHKRLTVLWSTAILTFAVTNILHTGCILALFDDESPVAICYTDKCPLLITEFTLAQTICAVIATLWLRSKQYTEVRPHHSVLPN